jgi:hypothetical protein
MEMAPARAGRTPYFESTPSGDEGVATTAIPPQDFSEHMAIISFIFQYFDESQHADAKILHDFRVFLQEIVEIRQYFVELLQAYAVLLQAQVKFLHEISVFPAVFCRDPARIR